MAHLSPFEFARGVQEACDRSELVVTYHVQILDDTVVKVRVLLINEAFIDVFYNADTDKCSFALVERGERIFGADNAFIGWHIHPFDDPSEHIPSSGMTFDDFLKAVESHATSDRSE
jgi:hypothetical protein